MENIVAVIVLVLLVGGAAAYIVRAKKNGAKCIGCPAGGGCSGSHKPKKKKLSAPVIGKKTIQISGMHCAHCVMSVTESLNRIEGVQAQVDLSKGNAVISYDREVGEDLLIQAVEKVGFQVVSIR